MKKRSERVLGLVLLAAVAACACGWTRTVQAQAIYGSVYGTITDKTGAAIPNATITVTDQSKGTSVAGDLQSVGRVHGPKSDSRRL